MARGLPTGGQGSKVYVLCAEPLQHKHFRPGTRPGGLGTRPGGSVTGVTEKLFMCQMFMCLFRHLNFMLIHCFDWVRSGRNELASSSDLSATHSDRLGNQSATNSSQSAQICDNFKAASEHRIPMCASDPRAEEWVRRMGAGFFF